MEKLNLVLKKINQESESDKIISDLVYILTQNREKRGIVSSLLRIAIRYVSLMDFYYETKENIYYNEAQKQIKIIYNSVDKSHHQKLKDLEKFVVNYFEYENNLKEQIIKGIKFNEKEIEEHILKKSEDIKLYCTIADFYYKIPPRIKDVIHKKQSLLDIIDDIKDYEEDLIIGEPNILILYFLNKEIPKDKWSKKLNEALNLISSLSIKEKILNFANRLYQNALDVVEFEQLPNLKKIIETKYNLLNKLFQND